MPSSKLTIRLLTEPLSYQGISNRLPPLYPNYMNRTSNSWSKITCLRHFCHESSTDWNEDNEFFNFTRARFIRDEERELAQRRVKFDMNALARLSANAVGSRTCVNIEKYPDGMFSKAFLMTMDDGKKIVAKVPNPNAGRAHFTTASEVATMDFVRNICGTPVPRVFAWSFKAEENPVGAEFIIMERITGVQLSSVWATMPIDKKTEIIKTLAAYQEAWMSASLKQYGSLYYAQDISQQLNQPAFSYLDKDGCEIVDKRFVVGPTVHRQSIDYGRAQVDFDRGPWDTVEDYCIATGNREISCVKEIQPLPKPPLTLVGRYIPTRAKKVAALQSYMKLVNLLLPTDSSITTSHVWHSDLHAENIFVNPDRPTEIVGIIDWQSVALDPLFENSCQPALLDYDGPPLNGLERPEEPKDLDRLDPVQRASAFDKYMDMTLASYYQNLIYYTNKRLFRAIEFRETISYDLLGQARNILIDGEAVYQKLIIDDLEKAWNTLPGVQALPNPPYPFNFSREELAAIEKDYEDMSDSILCMGQIQQEMGDLFPSDRCINHQNYDDAKKTLAGYKEKVLNEFARNEEERAAVMAWWPFDE